MESTTDRLAYLWRYLELGPQGNQEEEKESWQEAFDRLWSQSDDLTETEFAQRLDQLSALAEQEAAADIAACTNCTDATCELCSFLDSLFPAAQAGASAEYDERAHQPLAACCGFCSGCGHSIA